MIKGIDPTTDKVVTRSFTPLIPNQAEHPGMMDVLIKCYADGRMSRYIRTRGPGDELEIKGPMKGLDYYNGKFDRVGLVGGGSGITPLWQVLCTDKRIIATRSTVHRGPPPELTWWGELETGLLLANEGKLIHYLTTRHIPLVTELLGDKATI